ncbi:beta strand repeat-containing protein [Mastigocladopsis repens]|uniref:beta strand repeat-containing protein n=1 Tax=Mastigocladopsis repens TaxID=221287 RepID=UPI0002F658E6|nr:lamin tail domain-containing protein [Mastigocladopsis repens]
MKSLFLLKNLRAVAQSSQGKRRKKSKRVAGVLSAIVLGFGSQLLLPQVGLAQTAGVTVGTPSFTILDDACIVGGTPDSGDTITIATNLRNTIGSNEAFRVVFRATANVGGTTVNLSEDLLYGGPTYMSRNPTVGGSNWDDSYGQVVNTPIVANGGNYTVRANFGLNTQQMANALNLASGTSATVTFRAEVFSRDFSIYYGTASATQSITYRRTSACTSGRPNNTSSLLLTTNKAVYTSTDQITIENSTLGANDTTTTPSTTTGSKLPSWGDTLNDIVDIIRLDVPPTGNPETDYANNSGNVAATVSTWTTNFSLDSGSKLDEDILTSYYYSKVVGTNLTANTNYGNVSAGSLTPNKYYLVRLRPRLGTTGVNTNAGSASHPVLRPQYTYFAVGDPAPIGGSSDLTITKTHTGNFTQGGTGSYTITATNSGTIATSGTVTVTDTVPTGLTPTTATGTGWTCTISGQTVTCTRTDAIAAGASYPAITLGVNVAATAPASVTNTATVAGGGETKTDNNTANDPTTINAVSDLTITKTHTGNFSQGGTGSYTITARNSGGTATSGTVTVTDTLPTGLTPSTATGTGWTCTISGQTVTCTRTDALAVNTNYPAISLGVTVASNAPASITNTATVGGGGEANTTNNSASDPTTINGVADLTVTKTHTGNFTQGGTGSYTITATNSGGAPTSGTVTVTDTVPTGLTPTTATGTGWTCTISGQTVTCTRTDALAAAASYPAITLGVTVASNAASTVTNTAKVSGGSQTNTTNDTANDPTTINGASDLTITKTHTGNFILGSSGTYTITATNSGSVATTGLVTVADTLPTGLTPTAATGTGWTCTISGQTVTCTRLDALAAAASYPAISLGVTVAANAPSSITNTATVSGGGEANTTNNSASDPTTIGVYQVSPLQGKVIINEVLYAQTGANTAAANDEFIEIYNASNSTVDLSGWKLMDGNLIANSTDGTGSITGNSSPYVFPSGTTLAPGQYAVIWIGTNTSDRQASGATFQTWLGQSPSLNNTGDDVWLYDNQTQIVDYIAYGSGSAINTAPPSSLNLWNSTYQSALAKANTGQSISLTRNGLDTNTSACWEPTTSGTAKTQGCTNYLPTIDTDTVGTRFTSVGLNNNGFPKLLLVKRITAINGKTTNGTVDLTAVVDDPNSTDDNNPNWPASYLKGAINGGKVQPGDELEYTIYFLSSGGTPIKNVSICDLEPTNTTFVENAFASGSGIAMAIGSTSTNLTNANDTTDGGQFIPSGTEAPGSCNKAAFSGSTPLPALPAAQNLTGAVVVDVVKNSTTLPDSAPNSPAYGFIRFRAKVK